MKYPRFGLQFCHSRKIVSMVAGAIGVLMLGASAQAFTFNDQPSTGNSNDANFSKPADRTKSRMTGNSDDRSTIRSGNTTLQFGTRESSDSRSPADRYFNPNVLMGR